eukprot:5151419-Pyramimonas_sp.AAC.1
MMLVVVMVMMVVVTVMVMTPAAERGQELLARTALRTEAFPFGPAAATLGFVRFSAPSQIHL